MRACACEHVDPIPQKSRTRCLLVTGRAEFGWDFEPVVEVDADDAGNVDLVFVQQGVEVDSGEVGAYPLQSVTGVVAGLTDCTVMQEVLVQFGFDDFSWLYALTKSSNAHAVLLGVGREDMQ